MLYHRMIPVLANYALQHFVVYVVLWIWIRSLASAIESVKVVIILIFRV